VVVTALSLNNLPERDSYLQLSNWKQRCVAPCHEMFVSPFDIFIVCIQNCRPNFNPQYLV
jgi:hypothetical protein